MTDDLLYTDGTDPKPNRESDKKSDEGRGRSNEEQPVHTPHHEYTEPTTQSDNDSDSSGSQSDDAEVDASLLNARHKSR